MDKNLESDKLEKDAVEQPSVNEDVKSESKEIEVKAKTEETKPSEETSKTSESNLENLTKDEIIEQLKNLRMQEEIPTRHAVDSLKQAFYALRRAEVDAEKANFDADHEEGEVFTPSVDPSEDVLKVFLNDIKEKRAKKHAEEEHQKELNYNVKLGIIEDIKALTESTDDFNKLFKDFKDLQQKWNDIKLVPQAKAKELWTEYQIYTEKFYDLVKINNEFRDYDFKKNLDMKTELCESAEKLVTEADAVSAFHQLQNFHQQWREIGPVAREIREELWTRFKEISTTINRNYQEHFESLKGQEDENLVAKQAIIDELKKIDYSKIKSYKDWDAKSAEVIAVQAKWRTIGFVPRKLNNQIFEEFRGLCDIFFAKKSEFFKTQREEMDVNLSKKRALTDRALELKDSTDWKKATDEFVKIQRDWKKIGPVPRKHSDSIWKEFVAACDHFFDQKKKVFSSQKNEEAENFAAKKAIVEQIKNLDHALESSKLLDKVRELQDEWHKIGFVPFKEKDKSYKDLYAAVDAHYDRLKINKDERRFEEFKSTMEDKIANKVNPEKALSKERDHLTYQYNKLKSDLQTYQNNMSFLTVSSKGKDNPLLKDVNKKIESLKNEMELIEKKVEALDTNLKELE